jgi:putative effector of murein hydrolase LrgA (UPF0299 family)
MYMTAEDINIGIGALLETFEMMFVPVYLYQCKSLTILRIFGFLHVKAFSLSHISQLLCLGRKMYLSCIHPV